MTSSTRKTYQKIAQLESIAENCKSFNTSIVIVKPDGKEVTLIVEFNYYSVQGYHHSGGKLTLKQGNFMEGPRQNTAYYFNRPTSFTFTQIITDLATRFPKGKLDATSVKVRAKGCALKGKELKDLVLEAWCEARGVPIPSDNEMRQQRKAARNRSESKLEGFVKLLKTKSGIKKFNDMRDKNEFDGHFKKGDFSKFDLKDVKFFNLDLTGSKFVNAKITGSNSVGAIFIKSDFEKVQIKDSNFEFAKFKGANFKGATLKSSNFSYVDLRDTNFENAKLKKIDFSGTDLRGAKLEKADIDPDVLFDQTKYDYNTTFPDGYDKFGCRFEGGQPAEKTEEILKEIKADETLDFPAFLEKLDLNVDSSRLKKSLAMLQKDSFQLYSNVTNESVVGVVKSQTDPDLVYSCRLTKDGDFACCTQNLYSCGGLRGKLCKHLLLLMVALSKAGEIDASVADVWVRKSAIKKPKLDKDIMSEAFLNYKGAEAGEVDWRPTETIPEDFYVY